MALVLDGNGDITGLVAGALPSNVIGAGAVLQAVVGSYNSRLQSNSTTYADTGLSVTITPSSSSSRILIIGHQADVFKSNTEASQSIYLRLMRDATQVLLFSDRGLLTVSAIENMETYGFTYLDSPSTTSTITYKTQFKAYSTNGFVTVQQQSSSSSIIVALEIAG